MVGRLVLSILERVREPGGNQLNPVVLTRGDRHVRGRKARAAVTDIESASQHSDRAVHNGTPNSHTRDMSRRRRDCLSLPPAVTPRERGSPNILMVERGTHRRQHTIAAPACMRESLSRSTLPVEVNLRSSLMSTTDGMIAPPFVLSSRGTTAKNLSPRDSHPWQSNPIAVTVARRLLLSRTPEAWTPSSPLTHYKPNSLEPLATDLHQKKTDRIPPIKSPLAPTQSHASMAHDWHNKARADNTFWLITHPDTSAAVFQSSFRASTRAS